MNRAINVEWLDVEHVDMGLSQPRSWSPQRRANPYDAPLATTLQWAYTLPEPLEPKAVLRRFPRIANHIAASWRDPAVLNRYFRSLLLDERGDREGFPLDVREELAKLGAFYAWCQNEESWSALTLRI